MNELDRRDALILTELQRDSRQSIAQIAKASTTCT